jgi:hypothetical protein
MRGTIIEHPHSHTGPATIRSTSLRIVPTVESTSQLRTAAGPCHQTRTQAADFTKARRMYRNGSSGKTTEVEGHSGEVIRTIPRRKQ